MNQLERRLSKLEGLRAPAMTHARVIEGNTKWLQLKASGVVIMLPDNGRDNAEVRHDAS
jgi:hypothetical protein